MTQDAINKLKGTIATQLEVQRYGANPDAPQNAEEGYRDKKEMNVALAVVNALPQSVHAEALAGIVNIAIESAVRLMTHSLPEARELLDAAIDITYTLPMEKRPEIFQSLKLVFDYALDSAVSSMHKSPFAAQGLFEIVRALSYKSSISLPEIEKGFERTLKAATNAVIHKVQANYYYQSVEDQIKAFDKIVSLLPPEMKPATEKSFQEVFDASIKAAASRAASGNPIEEPLNVARRFADKLPPEKRPAIEDGFPSIFDAAVRNAAQSLQWSGVTPERSINLVIDLAERLPAEKKPEIEKSFQEIIDAAIKGAEFCGEKGMSLADINGRLSVARDFAHRLSPEKEPVEIEAKIKGRLQGIFNAEVASAISRLDETYGHAHYIEPAAFAVDAAIGLAESLPPEAKPGARSSLQRIFDAVTSNEERYDRKGRKGVYAPLSGKLQTAIATLG